MRGVAIGTDRLPGVFPDGAGGPCAQQRITHAASEVISVPGLAQRAHKGARQRPSTPCRRKFSVNWAALPSDALQTIKINKIANEPAQAVAAGVDFATGLIAYGTGWVSLDSLRRLLLPVFESVFMND